MASTPDQMQLAAAMLTFNLAFRSLPFAGYALFSRAGLLRTLGPPIVTAAAIGFALQASVDPMALLTHLAYAVFYYVGLAMVTHAARVAKVADAINPIILALACLSAFLVVPSMLLRGPALIPIVTFGFDRALAAYSYLASAPRSPRSLRTTLFFMLVDPSIVWARRAVAVESDASSAGILRCLQGLACLALVEVAVITQLLPFPARWPASATDYGAFAISVLLFLFVHYLSVSGAASWQLGLLRLFGYRAHERYDYPFLATSPLDFWRRWNIYVAVWLSSHVFVPLQTWLRRIRLPGWLASMAAVLLVFFASGFLHFVSSRLLKERFDPRILLGFVAYGAIVVGLLAVSRAMPALSAFLTSHGRLSRALGRLATINLIIVFAWYVVPLLGGL